MNFGCWCCLFIGVRLEQILFYFFFVLFFSAVRLKGKYKNSERKLTEQKQKPEQKETSLRNNNMKNRFCLRIDELNCVAKNSNMSFSPYRETSSTTMTGLMENGTTVVYCGQGLDDFHTR